VTVSTNQQTLRRLTVIVGIQWMGATLGLPLLPLFLEHRGGTPTEVGFVMSAFFVAGLLTQFVIGHMADRFGRRPLLLAGLVAYGAASVTYLLPVGAAWFTISRAIQGAGAGAIEVASLSAVAALFAESQRGRAISRILAAQLLGAALGPLLGSLVPLDDLGWAFFATGVASCLASLRAVRADLGDTVVDPTPLPKLQRTPQLYGALVAAISVGLCVGVYETCWSLLMKSHHASTFEIRLSWTLFCLPWVALSGVGGWLADHANRKIIAIMGTLNAAGFLALYPHIHNTVLLLMLGPVESVGASLSMPSTSSLLSQGATPREMGRRQGLSTTANTAALALSAATTGVLFSVSPVLPFTAIAIVSASCTTTLWWWWRRVVGHVSH
jgi:DHA1 family multidrug resistance protein-like MFS transporter